jgi:predicted nucleic acid-binding protein
MRVYVESNFLLELVLEQEQHHACEELLTLAASRTIELALPAFALIEPYESMVRDERDGSLLAQSLRASATLRSGPRSTRGSGRRGRHKGG